MSRCARLKACALRRTESADGIARPFDYNRCHESIWPIAPLAHARRVVQTPASIRLNVQYAQHLQRRCLINWAPYRKVQGPPCARQALSQVAPQPPLPDNRPGRTERPQSLPLAADQAQSWRHGDRRQRSPARACCARIDSNCRAQRPNRLRAILSGSVCPADQFPEAYRRRGTGTLRAARVGRKDRKGGRVARRASRKCSRTGIIKLFPAEYGERIAAPRRPLENALNYGFGKYSNGSTGLPCLRTSKCSMTRLASLSPISAIFWPCATVSFSLANSLRLCAYAVRKVALCFTMMR